MPRTKEAFESMREATRQKIEAAALSLFARKGLSVKVREIAAAARVSQGLLYSHYPSKEALISALMLQGVTISSQAIAQAAGSEGRAVEKLRQITDMMCRMFSEASIGIDYFMFVVQAMANGFPVPETARYSPERPPPMESLARIIVQGQNEGAFVQGDPLELSIHYWAAIQGLCCYAIAYMPVSPNPKMLNRIVMKERYV